MLYKLTDLNDAEISAKDLAEICNVTQTRLYQLSVEGAIPKEKRSKHRLVECVKGYIRFLQVRQKRGRAIASNDIEESRARKAAADAEIAELDLAKARSEIITLKDHDAVLSNVYEIIKTSLLAIPTRSTPNIAQANGIREIKDVLELEIHDILSDLSRTLADSSISMVEAEGTTRTDGQEAASTPKTNHKRVGRPRKSAIL